uniref:Sugar transporter SWEET1 n=2 Tax=Phytophthora ramorum TaxID=164328 RepID=H3GD91_PHYRM
MGSSALVTLLHMTTAAIQIGMNLSPAPDMHRVQQFKTTGQMAVLPLVLMCFNNHLWLLYGLLAGSIFPLCAAALVGEIAGVIFTAVYYRWARNTLETRRTCSAGAVGMALVTLYVLLGVAGRTGQSYDQVVQSLGYVGATINICMYASPLATVKVVLETKSSASMPINLCSMIFLNCCMWVATSIVDNDMFVLIPSVLGLVFSGVQLPLYFIYRSTNPYVDLDAQLEEGYGTSATKTFDSVKHELDAGSALPTTYRTVRPSRIARFTSFNYQRAEGTPLTVGSNAMPSFSGTEKSPRPFGELSPFPTPGALHYSHIANEGGDLEMQPLIMTPIAA